MTERHVIYAYTDKKTKEYAHKLCIEHNQPMGKIVSFLFNHLKENAELQAKIETHVPQFVKKATEWKSKKKAKKSA